jgi:hypothetical protein
MHTTSWKFGLGALAWLAVSCGAIRAQDVQVTSMAVGTTVQSSSLQHRFVAIHDPSCALDFVGTPTLPVVSTKGIKDSLLTYVAKITSLGIVRECDVTVQASRDVQAVEVDFAAVDVFGRFTGLYRASAVADVKVTRPLEIKRVWVCDFNDFVNQYATVAYISLVRTTDGVWQLSDSGTKAVLAECAKLCPNIGDSLVCEKGVLTTKDKAQTLVAVATGATQWPL